MKTIGIPKALVYWKRPYFWEEFFRGLGCNVLLSPSSNKKIVEMGVKEGDPETCFSNKVYWGHLIWLDGKCDYIFVPRLKTDKHNLEYCPKLFGLPDLAKIMVDTPLLAPTIDNKKESLDKTLYRTGSQLNKTRSEVKSAKKKALKKEKKEEERGLESFRKKMASDKIKIVLVSHPYNLYDQHVNLRIEEKLESLGVEPIFLDEIPEPGPEIIQDILSSEDLDFHWEFGKEIIEKIREIFKYNITGGIEISAFQCGCDGVIKEFVEREFKTRKIPFLYLILDEHTGEAGFQTRLEAFIDTLN